MSVLFCEQCTLAQLSVVVDPSVLYDHYPYVTSTSDTMKAHFGSLLSDIQAEHGEGPVLEIGSNDGTLLHYLALAGLGPVIGIDPAGNLAASAADKHVQTITALFDEESAKDAARILKRIGVVIARHVFAHVDDWKRFIASIELLSSPDTLVCIEVPYCANMLERNEWDTIYHEHLSYVTVKAVHALLQDSEFHLHRILQYPVHGGSMLLMLRRNDHESIRHASVDEYLEREQIGLDEWKKFSVNSRWQIAQLSEYVSKLKGDGMKVCGFGASAKSTVAISAARLSHETIDFVTDTTPQKQGRLSPGTLIPVVSPDALLSKRPDYAICFAWNYRDEILRRNTSFRERGGKFIFFVPKLEVV